MRELIIDRFEETYVVCQTPDGQLDAFPRKRLPEGAEEGCKEESRNGGKSN